MSAIPPTPSRDTARPVRVRLLPFAIAAPLGLTVFSIELAWPDFTSMLFHAGIDDVLRNVVLYLPLGFALGRTSKSRLLAIALAVSFCAELIQAFYPNRYTSLVDVGANTVGALLGWTLFGRLARHSGERPWMVEIPVQPPLAVACAIAAALFVTAMSVPRPAADFSNWDTGFPVMIGAEPTGDRTWAGRVHRLVVATGALDRPTIERLHREGPGAESTGSEAYSYLDVSDVTPGDPRWGRPLLDDFPRAALYHAMLSTNTLSLLVWFQTSDIGQEGPARIVTCSDGPQHRNFTIGQEKRQIEFRLRTPRTGKNGKRPSTSTREILRPDSVVFVAATYDGRISRIYVDGRRISRANLTAYGAPLGFLSDVGLPAAAMLTGGLFAAVGIVLARTHRRWLALTGGAAGGALLWLTGGTSPVPAFGPWAPAFGTVAGAVVAWALRE